jgi:hypothetical protein
MKKNNINYQNLDKENLEKQKLISEIKSNKRKWLTWVLPIAANILIAIIAWRLAKNSEFFETQTKLIEIKNFELKLEQKKLDTTLKIMNNRLDSINGLFLLSQDSILEITRIAKLKDDSIKRISFNLQYQKSLNKKQKLDYDSLAQAWKNFTPSKTNAEIKDEVSILINEMNKSMDQINRVVKFYENIYGTELNQWNYSWLLTTTFPSDYEIKALQYRKEIAYALNEEFPGEKYYKTSGIYYDRPLTSSSINGIINDLQKNVDKIPD